MFPLKDENPVRSRPLLTYALILTNSAIFFGLLLTGRLDDTIRELGMRPAEVLSGRRLHTLFTSMFLHGGFLHIVGNMWYLWIFGDNIEDVCGKGKFLLFYFGSGLIASIAHAISAWGSMIPAIGASGAISGVLGAYALLYPRARVHTAIVFFFIHLTMLPAVLLLGFWFVLQVLSASVLLVTGLSPGVAYWAHIGGFIAGVALITPKWLRTRKRRGKVVHF